MPRGSFLLLLGLCVSRNSSRLVLSCQPSWPFTPLCPTPVSKSQLHRRIPPPVLLIFLKRVQRYNTRCQHSHPWLVRLNIPEGAFATKISIEVFLKASCLSWNHLDFVLMRVALGKLRSIWGNLFLQLWLLQYYSYYLSSSTLSQVVLGAILEMLFVSLCECSAVNSAQLSRGTQMCSAWRETNPDDFLIFGFQRRSLPWSGRRARPWTCPEKPPFCVNQPHVPHKDSHGQLVSSVSKTGFSVPTSKELLSSARTIKKKYWPHLEQTLPKSLLHTTLSARLGHPIQS